MYEAFPLHWPCGYQRADAQHSSHFKITADIARKGLLAEIERLSHDKNPIISSNVPLRKRDGHMYADVANDAIDDAGVAAYFLYNDKPVVLACDYWVIPADNVRALSLTIEALRGIGRWKATQILERTFNGFPALPEVTAAETDIWQVLELPAKPASAEEVRRAYQARLKIVHPDKPTGNRKDFDKLQEAYRKALLFYSPP